MQMFLSRSAAVPWGSGNGMVVVVEGGGVAIRTECHELLAFYRQQTV